MWVSELRVRGVRCLEAVELEPVAGLNVLLGLNGAGKTSVLEALALLAGGRSFRTARVETIVSKSVGALEVFASVEGQRGIERLGLARRDGQWSLRVNGESVSRLSRFTETLATVFFEPDSHELLAGGSEGRRRFLDWGVFHVEHGFGTIWSRYQRALLQRNALLKRSVASPSELDVWDQELSEFGEAVDRARSRFLLQFRKTLVEWCGRLAPELGVPEFRMLRGWNDGALIENLIVTRERDLALGYTSRGPHRADWLLRFEGTGGRDELSRGQMKLACFALSRAMVSVYAEVRGENPVACLDDLCSELDTEHQGRCLEALDGQGAQVWVTGTEWRSSLERWTGPLRMFHVEQGRVRPQLHAI